MDTPTLGGIIGLFNREAICAFDRQFRLLAFNQAHSDEFFRDNGFHTKVGDVFLTRFLSRREGSCSVSGLER